MKQYYFVREKIYYRMMQEGRPPTEVKRLRKTSCWKKTTLSKLLYVAMDNTFLLFLKLIQEFEQRYKGNKIYLKFGYRNNKLYTLNLKRKLKCGEQ